MLFNLHSSLYFCIRFVLFRFDPEVVHDVVSYILRLMGFFAGLVSRLHLRSKNPLEGLLQTRVGRHVLPGPVFMAAGFDKNGSLVNGLHTFGFGLAEVGTFTLRAQAGNPRPRLFRIPAEKALFNRMGFNNPGIEKGLENLRRARYPFAISIGKSKETPVEKAAEDYEEILKTMESTRFRTVKNHIVYVAINISSPNTPGLRQLQDKTWVLDLVKRCKKITELPLFVKFAPDFSTMGEFENTLKAALKAGADGVIVTNTTSDEKLTGCVAEEIRKNGGGLSGKPLTARSGEYLEAALGICKGAVPVISSGGVMSAEEIARRLKTGASAVQVYTGFIYNGPCFVKEATDYLEEEIQEGGFLSLAQYQAKPRARSKTIPQVKARPRGELKTRPSVKPPVKPRAKPPVKPVKQKKRKSP